MPVEFMSRWDITAESDRDHSKRRDLSRQGIKIPNDFRRGRKNRSRRA